MDLLHLSELPYCHPDKKKHYYVHQRAKDLNNHAIKVIGIRLLAPVQNSVSLELMQRKTLNFVINLPDVENITK